MSLASERVRAWMDSRATPLNIAAAAQAAGIGRISLSRQLMRGKVQSNIIADICRTINLDPLAELAGFDEYRDLHPGPPDPRETLAFIDWPELLKAVGMDYRDQPFTDADLGPVVFPDSSRIWADMIDGGAGNLRGEVAKELGVSASSVAHSLTQGLRSHVAAAFARCAGTPVSSSLVVSGILTPTEAGWPPDVRSRAVREASVPDLLELVRARTVSAQRNERRVLALEEEIG